MVRANYPVTGNRFDGHSLLRQAKEELASTLAEVYAQLRRKEETLRYLELAYVQHAPYIAHIQSNSHSDFLHSEPRYRAIVKKMGLPPVY